MSPPSVPYERQLGPADCGAAALTMVLRSLGRSVTQADLRPAISRNGRAHTHLLAQAALGAGLQAVIVQAARSWDCLRTCLGHSLRVIVNHRIDSQGRAGHYSVVTEASEEEIVLHDPRVGPSTRHGRLDFEVLWGPARHASEVRGHVLLAIAEAGDPGPCQLCGNAWPEESMCPWCRKSFQPRPAAALGCELTSCPGRLWSRCYCPWCDLPRTQWAATQQENCAWRTSGHSFPG